MPPVKALVGLAAILSIACLLLLYLEPSPTRHISLFARNPADASPTYSSKTVGTGSQPAAEDADSNGAPHLGELTPPVIPLELAIHEPHFELGVLQKQANSSRLRLVFLVGLEGTGHHYMADVLENVCRRAHVACPKVCNLAKAMYPGIALPKTPYDYMVARGELRAEMEKLALTAESIPPNESTVVGFGPCRFEAGMMSYPNFNGDDKVLQYVDFKVVAEEAERARIDLRIIYLSRSAKDILISDTWHNHYSNSFMMEARVLMANAAIVDSTFQELGSGFTVCFRYENITDPYQALRVANFVAPTNSSAVHLSKTMLAKVKTGSSRKSKRRPKGPFQTWPKSRANEDFPNEAQLLVVDRMQQKLDKIEREQCSW